MDALCSAILKTVCCVVQRRAWTVMTQHATRNFVRPRGQTYLLVEQVVHRAGPVPRTERDAALVGVHAHAVDRGLPRHLEGLAPNRGIAALHRAVPGHRHQELPRERAPGGQPSKTRPGSQQKRQDYGRRTLRSRASARQLTRRLCPCARTTTAHCVIWPGRETVRLLRPCSTARLGCPVPAQDRRRPRCPTRCQRRRARLQGPAAR